MVAVPAMPVVAVAICALSLRILIVTDEAGLPSV